MPNLMVALPNIGGALCSTPQSLADAHYYTVSQKNCAKLFLSELIQMSSNFD